MAKSELLEISRSRTLRSRRASAARSEIALVGLNAPSSSGDRGSGDASDVSIVGRSLGGLVRRAIVPDFTSWARGDGEASAAVAVADRRLELCELPESIDDRLGDFL